MGWTRREAIGLGVAAGASLALAGCSRSLQKIAGRELPARIEPPDAKAGPTVRLLNRMAFGALPGQVAQVQSDGREAYVHAQLESTANESPYLLAMLHRLDALRIDTAELQDLPESAVLGQLQQAALLRAVYSPNQLRERMVDLWSNHFNIYARKAEGAYFKPADDLKVIRARALGKFPDLLRASAKSPAMLRYLDNQENRAGVPNENYARELLELHTLGVDGGYEYRDIKELARCLTGWTVEDRFLKPYGKWRFDPEKHDDGAKIVLGTRIPPGGGEKDVEIVLDLLAKHPSTARFIAGKVCRYFLGEAASTWTDRTARTFGQTGGDIRVMLRPILLSRELLEGPPILKRPFDFVVSSLRALGANTDAERPLRDHLERMGQPLFEWPMPDGYPDKTAAWTGSLLARWNFALALAANSIPGTEAPFDAWRSRLGEKRGPAIWRAIVGGPPSISLGSREVEESAALAISSPEFQWR